MEDHGADWEMKNPLKNSGCWIDLQVNGLKGVSFSDIDLNPENFSLACRGILDGGTEIFLPTVITSPVEVYERNLKLMV